MSKKLPLRRFRSVSNFHQQWQVSPDDINQWLIYGELRAHIWLPLTSLYEITEQVEGSRIVQTKQLCHQDGYMQIFPYDCRRLISRGEIEIRDFSNLGGAPIFSVPEAAPGILVQFTDLVILESERLRFEESHGLAQVAPRQPRKAKPFDVTFRHITFKDQSYLFGAIQAAILRKLYEAAQDDSPWLNGKQLLASAGSRSYAVANVFKRRSIWRELIHSDQRGYYRLQPQFLESLSVNEPKPLRS